MIFLRLQLLESSQGAHIRETMAEQHQQGGRFCLVAL
jgi:hypothetical protein